MIDLEKIDLIHAHKLTYEGYIAYYLSEIYQKPFFVSLRQTDFRVLKFRPDLLYVYKKILMRAAKIFYIVPYMTGALRYYVGDDFYSKHVAQKLVSLPNRISRAEKDIPVKPVYGSLLTILRMEKKSVRRKGLKKLFEALIQINNPSVTLKIIGEGNYKHVVEEWVDKYNLQNRVELIGAVKNSEIDRYYREAYAFVLPSRSETFGLVYGEALINGVPILYSKGTGFDGFFDNVGAKINPVSVDSIKDGLIKVINNNNDYRENIKRLKKKMLLIFSHRNTQTRFIKIVCTALKLIFKNQNMLEVLQ